MTSILWRSTDNDSFEFFRLRQSDDGHWLSGTVVMRLEGKPAKIDYLIKCDQHWHTRDVAIVQDWNGEARSLGLTVNAAREWQSKAGPYPTLTGLIDVDLAITPSTNLLPLKRYALEIGDSLETAAAWVQFPSLTIDPLVQKYTRLSATEYAYESPSLRYSAVHTFDENDICVTYGDLWVRA